MKLTLTLITFLTSIALSAADVNPGKEPFKSNLPIVLLDTENQLTNTEKRDAHMRVIYSEGKKQYSSTDTNYQYDGTVAIKLRGNSSLSFSQKKYTFELRDSAGKDLDASLMGMPAHSDWVLLAPYTDVSMIRDVFAFQLWRDMGHWAPRTQLCELVLNGEYAGVYALAEAIKRDKERVNIDKMKKTDISGREVTGGYLLRIDTFDDDDATFRSQVPGIGDGLFMTDITWTCLYPKKKKLQPEQMEYISNFIADMERTFASDNYTDPTSGYAAYIDIPSFVDYFIHTEFSLNADAYKRSAYFYKERQNPDGTGGLLHAGPVWDYNLAYGCCSFCNADDINAWAFEGCNTNPTPLFWKRLYQDPAFMDKVRTRYAQLRKTTLSTSHLFGLIDGYARQLQKAQQRHFGRYPELLGSETRRNPAGSGMMAGMGGMMPGAGMGQMLEGAFPPFGGGFPAMGGFPGMGQMNDSTMRAMMEQGRKMFEQMRNNNTDTAGATPQMGGFPPSGAMPGMGGGFPGMGGGFPGMGGGFPGMGGGFPGMGNMPAAGGTFPQMGDMAGMGPMGGAMLSWFRSYTVKDYDDEIKMLKDWLKERLEVLDEKILRK